MGGDNTQYQKMLRARKRVMISYMKHEPGYLQEEAYREFCAQIGVQRHETLEDIIRDSGNYEIDARSGYETVVHKMSLCVQNTKVKTSLCLEELKIKQKFNNSQ